MGLSALLLNFEFTRNILQTLLTGREMANITSFDCRIHQALLIGYRNIKFNFSNLPQNYTQNPKHLPNVEIEINGTYQCVYPKKTHKPIPIVIQTKLSKSDKAQLICGGDFTPSLCPPGDSKHHVCEQQHITFISPIKDQLKDEV